jgi:hypothetical protein
MVFSVSIGFSQLTRSADDPTIYALFVGDTVKVQESESALELTGMSKKKLKSIAIFLGVGSIFLFLPLPYVESFHIIVGRRGASTPSPTDRRDVQR